MVPTRSWSGVNRLRFSGEVAFFMPKFLQIEVINHATLRLPKLNLIFEDLFFLYLVSGNCLAYIVVVQDQFWL